MPSQKSRSPAATSCGGRRQQRHAAQRLGGVGRERLRPGPGGGTERIQPAQALARGHELGVLALIHVHRVDLGELVLEQLEVALTLVRHGLQRLEPGPQPGAVGVRPRAGAQARCVIATAHAVQQLQLRGRDR